MLYKFAVSMLCLLLLTGCWSRRELNELLIVLGMGIDWEDGHYLVSYQVVNPSEISNQQKRGDRPPSTLFQGRGRTLFEAARSVTTEAPRKVYLGHLQIYVIGEEAARRGINELIDVSARDNETRMDFNIIIAKGTKAENVLKLYTPVEKLPSYSMQQSLQTSEKNWAPTIAVTLDEALTNLSSQGSELALTGIRVIGSPEIGETKQNVEKFLPPSRFRYSGIAAFKGDKLIGWLNERESRGYTDITNNLDSTTIAIPCGEQRYLGVEVTSSNSKIKTKVVNGKPEVEVAIRTEANIVERSCTDVDLSKPETIKELEAKTKQSVQTNVEDAVSRAKEMKSDIFGFGTQMEKDHPAFWNQVKDKWRDEYFPKIKVNYKIQIFIRDTGTTMNSTIK
ncbi:Ger(x)C family spore germination protein [Paenibacillus glycanilyticus]|uniref:Ger(x)C family spore germination protein n=1 Tax=Paenibacillus glycanilyticus TaxID=126569 RepID=UPI002041384B|nr:Ger(x)C family spore germination protein [Paenibacillus glycanilyticus]MCM3630598.1 Ger(x)C family spore germination protein [Paenibacillus glycanilyticus]